MATTIRRVLMVMVLLAGVMPWLTGQSKTYAQSSGASEAPSGSAEEPASSDTPTPDPATNRPSISLATGSKIAIIEIDGAIMGDFQFESIQRRVERAVKDGADLIVFDIDTPGGALVTALDISSYIRTMQVPTVAWVNNQALSAGILISSACDEIVMSRGSLTGDCAPIVPGQSLAPTERAKALSPLLADFRANAMDNYAGPTTSDYGMFHAMCVLGIEVYQVRHKLSGEERLVSQADYAVMVDGVSPIDAGKPVTASNGSALVPLDSPELTSKAVVTVTDASQVGDWELVRQVHDGSTLLTVNEVEALDIGLSRATISSEKELLTHYSAASVQRYNETWSESLVGFLVNPFVRAALLLLGIAGLLMEYFSPGLFVPGIIGILAFAALIGAPLLIGLAQTWHILLIVIGIGLVVYELITMTTFGVLAVLGLLMFITGLVLSGVQSASNGLPADGSYRQLFISSMSFVGAIVLTVPLLIVMTKYFGSLPLLNRLVLNESQQASIVPAGKTASPYQRIEGDESVGGGKIKVGMTGKVTTTGLRPGGRVEIEDQLIDVTSTGGFVEAGTEVRVVEVHGNMISVEPIDNA